jgi:molybdopterin-biosynthesis enzyme MoeA-like protein
MPAETAVRNIGLIIVGDEILSGRRVDQHFDKIVDMLAQRGLQLSWAQILRDDRQQLSAAYRRSFASGDIVFSCGGIGATPDDHTRQAAAVALGVELVLHPQAKEQIALRCAELAQRGQGSADMNTPENQQRLQMGMFPVGSEMVPNPYNGIPGFSIRDHTFVPGFPVMAWPMLEWMLDTRYRSLHHAAPYLEHSFLVYDLPESRITPAMEAVQRRWPEIKVFSLPSVGENAQPHLELGVKGEPEAAGRALEFLHAETLRLGGRVTTGDN